MNHNYYEHYDLWCYVNGREQSDQSWADFISEEFDDRAEINGM